MLSVRNGYMSQLEMRTRIRLKGEIPRLGVCELEVQAVTESFTTSLGSLCPCWASVSGLQSRIARVQVWNVPPQAQGLNTKSLVTVLKLWDLGGARSWKRWAFESCPVLSLAWLPVHTIAWFWSGFCPHHRLFLVWLPVHTITCFLSDFLSTPCKLCLSHHDSMRALWNPELKQLLFPSVVSLGCFGHSDTTMTNTREQESCAGCDVSDSSLS